MLDPHPDWREPTPEEAALLKEALAGEWSGATELRTQLPGVLTRPGCPCGCGTIALRTTRGVPAAGIPNPAPREGVVLDDGGAEIGGLLLFVRNGFLQSLEIYAHEGSLPLPTPDRVRWHVVPR